MGISELWSMVNKDLKLALSNVITKKFYKNSIGFTFTRHSWVFLILTPSLIFNICFDGL